MKVVVMMMMMIVQELFDFSYPFRQPGIIRIEMT